VGDGGAAASDGSSDAGADVYSGPCTISASGYDQSCTVDTDCTEVTSRDYCSAGCLCGGSAINVGALSQFNSDVSQTPLGSGALKAAACPCAAQLGPCCRGGTCTMACSSSADSLAACVDAGGTCILSGYAGGGAACNRQGPPDACAYSDETCCLN
jgi:hypothetical protein